MTAKKKPTIQTPPPSAGLHYRSHEFQAAPTGWEAHYFTGPDHPGETITHPLAGWLTLIEVDHDNFGDPWPPPMQEHHPLRKVRAAIANPRTGIIVPVEHSNFYRITGPGYELDETETFEAWTDWKNQMEETNVETS